jgi:hypothetical protein
VSVLSGERSEAFVVAPLAERVLRRDALLWSLDVSQ